MLASSLWFSFSLPESFRISSKYNHVTFLAMRLSTEGGPHLKYCLIVLTDLVRGSERVSVTSREKGVWEHHRKPIGGKSWERKQQGCGATKDRGGTGSHGGGGEPLDAKRTNRRRRCPEGASSERSQATPDGRAARTHPSRAGERSVSLWMCRRGLEQPQTGSGAETSV
jgi:hypothetical protein